MILLLFACTNLWAARAPAWFTKLAAQKLTRMEMLREQDLADFMDQVEAEYRRQKIPLYRDALERAERTSIPLDGDTPLIHLELSDRLRNLLAKKFDAHYVYDLTGETRVHEYMVFRSPPALQLELRKLLMRIQRVRAVCGSQLELFPSGEPLKNNPK